jgi:hypothetical protein
LQFGLPLTAWNLVEAPDRELSNTAHLGQYCEDKIDKNTCYAAVKGRFLDFWLRRLVYRFNLSLGLARFKQRRGERMLGGTARPLPPVKPVQSSRCVMDQIAPGPAFCEKNDHEV